MRKNSVKNIRINSEVQRALCEILDRDSKDPRIQGAIISVTDVSVTPDLKYCKAYISVLGTDEEAAQVMEGLKSANGYIRHELARMVNLRNTPEIEFILDKSIEHGVDMVHLIDEVNKGGASDEHTDSDD